MAAPWVMDERLAPEEAEAPLLVQARDDASLGLGGGQNGHLGDRWITWVAVIQLSLVEPEQRGGSVVRQGSVK